MGEAVLRVNPAPLDRDAAPCLGWAQSRSVAVRKLILAAVAALTAAAPALAHDFWLQPRRFEVAAGAAVPLTVLIGHAEAKEIWSRRPERIVRFDSTGPGGARTDHRARMTEGERDLSVPLAGAGVHVIALETNPIESDLPAVRFNAYLEEEGLTPALALRRATRRTDAPGREIYSRRCKALVRVGAVRGAQPQVTRPLGLTLEITPAADPYAVRAGERLPFTVTYQGRPLAGALVKLTDLNDDDKPLATARTDAAGRVVFPRPGAGAWLVNVVWTRPLVGDRRADFDTVFSSLTFGSPATG